MEESTPNTTASLLMTVGMLVLLGLVFYFLMWRPQKKQQRETDAMRNSVERGDVITTIGGIVGLVIVVKDNDILLETSGDKTRIQIQKWAVRSIEKKSS
ncbi:MAG: preprotein translocase subunit YajC [Clostridia bacterium]|jgi:preprotein translocase subunit YajC|nr:preprotein translocase subunit YajC [Clostridia bacterium]MBQ6043302.1 preprotein translocase subunit YajC [Clostridia bacterium]MBQ6183513.1 preprotein translocase subunit YajC [Clostridia bacterium]